MATKYATRQKIAEKIDKRENFTFGNISGRWVTSHQSAWNTAWLPDFLRDQLNASIEQADTYVVYSYTTPMAWNNGTQGKYAWFQPEVSYSKATTHHQSVIAVAIMENSPYLS
jgi:hypothetical protein